MENAFKLHLENDKGEVRKFDFDQNKVIIGRDPSSGLVIDDVEISRVHLVVIREKGGFFVEDKKSTNGTSLGGKQIKKKTEIKHDDQLVLGQNYTLRLEVLQPEELIEKSVAAEVEDEFKLEASVERGLAEALTEPSSAPVIESVVEPVVESVVVPVSEPAFESSQYQASHTEVEAEDFQQQEVVLQNPKKKTKPAGKDRPKWLIILLAALVFIVVFCVIPLIVIEATNQWCDLFAGFFNSFSPNVCP